MAASASFKRGSSAEERVLEILNRVILSITYSTDSALEMLISLNDLPSAHKPVSPEHFYRRGVPLVAPNFHFCAAREIQMLLFPYPPGFIGNNTGPSNVQHKEMFCAMRDVAYVLAV